MKISKRLEPRIYDKRWIILLITGIIFVCIGLSGLIYYRNDPKLFHLLFVLSSAAGIIMSISAVRMEIRAVFLSANDSKQNSSIDVRKINNLVYEKRVLIRGPKVVVIGGGTGLSTMLRGIKLYTSNITAIVTVADDGGGSGILREELGILPPGDIRNCILALADTEPVMEELLQYRFTDGTLKGQNFGNLFLAAMNGISDSFEEAVKRMSDVLAVTGQVLPVTSSNVKLFAELENGVIIEGESKIPKREQYKDVPIKRVFIEPSGVKPLKEALEAIDEADAVILGPGSLYTSIIPNLLVDDIVKHIAQSKALKIYVANIMTQPGETNNYSVYDHIEAIIKHSRQNIIDYVIVNNGSIPKQLYGKYVEDGAIEVRMDREKIQKLGVSIIEDDLININKNLVRHNSKKLAEMIMKLILDERLSKDRKRLIEAYYLSEHLKIKNN